MNRKTDDTLTPGEAVVGAAVLTLGSAAVFAVLIAVLIAASVLNAFVITELWAMFAVTQFGVKPLSVAMAFGLSILASLFWAAPSFVRHPDATVNYRAMFMYLFLRPLLAWGLGYLAYTYFVV
jgi:hypothetical protein